MTFPNSTRSTMSAAISQKKKARRVSRACDYCHRRSVQCRPSGDGVNCINCVEFDQPCTFMRPAKRRGVAPRVQPSITSGFSHMPPSGSKFGPQASYTVPSNKGPDEQWTSSQQSSIGARVHVSSNDSGSMATQLSPATSHQETNPEWRAPTIASQATIMDLVELYFEIVYPIFPLFHQPSFIRSVSRGEYTTKRNLFASTMAVCALVAARVRHGAISNPRWDLETLNETSSETFYAEAVRQAAQDEPNQDHNLMRAHALLAICAIQYGRVRDMHQHLGKYHTLVAMDDLHDEANWPRGIGIVEIEERRRLFWSIYTLDVYTSVVWMGVIRCREQQSNVSYPTEVDDDMFDNNGFSTCVSMSPTVIGHSTVRTGTQVQSSSWLCGWNFITDLYRVLEHVVTHFRDCKSRTRKQPFLHDIFGDLPSISQASVQNRVMAKYINLPQCFKETPPITYDIKQDRFGFQAANITATIQLVRMMLFAAGGASIEDRCQIANEVVSAFIAIPVSYLQAISSPLLYHLCGIGQILGSVFEEPLNEADYDQVRSVMLSMAQLLANLEGLHSSANASEKLRSQVARIDEYMLSQRKAQTKNPRNVLEESCPTNKDNSDGPVNFHSHAAGNANGQSLLSPFQLPMELLDDWPWSFEFAHPYVDGI